MSPVQSVGEAEAWLAATGVVHSFDWTGRFGEARSKQQKELAADVSEAKAALLRSVLPEADRVDFDSCGGGGGLFLLPPLGRSHRLCDEYLYTSLRRRLRVAHPAHDPARMLAPSTHCKHRKASGLVCDEELDARGHHAAYCSSGGGSVHGHDAIVKWLAAWITQWSGLPASTEQYVPAWDRTNSVGLVERARLDVSFVDAEGRRAYADVAVTSAFSIEQSVVLRRAQEPGLAALEMVRAKRARYRPEDNVHAALVPFVVESLGRVSAEARALIRSLAPDGPDRSVVIRSALQDLAVLVQTRLAEQLLSAEAGRKRGT